MSEAEFDHVLMAYELLTLALSEPAGDRTAELVLAASWLEKALKMDSCV